MARANIALLLHTQLQITFLGKKYLHDCLSLELRIELFFLMKNHLALKTVINYGHLDLGICRYLSQMSATSEKKESIFANDKIQTFKRITEFWKTILPCEHGIFPTLRFFS